MHPEHHKLPITRHQRSPLCLCLFAASTHRRRRSRAADGNANVEDTVVGIIGSDDDDDDEADHFVDCGGNMMYTTSDGNVQSSSTSTTFNHNVTDAAASNAAAGVIGGNRSVAAAAADATADTAITFAMSPWSTPCMIIGQYLYNCHSRKNDRAYWRCHNYSKKQQAERCRARCVIANGCVQAMTGGTHNHEPHTVKIEKIMARRRPPVHTAAVAAAAAAIDGGGGDGGDAGHDAQKITFLAATQLDEYAVDKDNMIIFD